MRPPLALLILALSAVASAAIADSLSPPIAAQRPVTRTIHGVTLSDPYAWLRADDWQAAIEDVAKLPADIRGYLDAENAYAAAMLAAGKPLEDQIFAELRGRTKEDEETTPLPDGAFAYYDRGVPGAEHGLHLRRPRDGGAEEVLLDGNALAAGTTFFALGGTAHSPDHRLIAYATDTEGSERYVIAMREIATGRDLSDRLANTDASMIWAPDATSLYYVALDDELRARRVMRHRIGTPQADDTLVYDEPELGFLVSIGLTQDRRYLVISSGSTTTSEVRVLDLADAAARPRLMAPRQENVRISLDHGDDRFTILVNDGTAEDFRIVTAADADPSPANWREIVPHQLGRPLKEVVVYRRHLVWTEQRDGLDSIAIRRLADGAEHRIAFPEEAFELGIAAGYEFDTSTLVFTYSSMTTPLEVYAYDMETRERRLLRRQEVPSGHDPARYVTRRLFATAADGERIPISILHATSTPLDGTAPLLLEGYGAYGSSTVPYFDQTRLSLVDRGFVYAIAHVRGGLEGGERWYRLGRGPNKRNTMTDFIAVARYLGSAKIAAPKRIIAYGGSAGGLLMGAVANMAPETFHGIVADVPFVDALNTMLDDTLPLTPNEFPEWGNPITDPVAFATIRDYAPYENVARQPYPHMLVLTSLSDTRVTYWEPAKWVAKLRAMKTNDNLLVFEIELDAGHAGVSGQLKTLRRWARIYAFVVRVAALP